MAMTLEAAGKGGLAVSETAIAVAKLRPAKRKIFFIGAKLAGGDRLGFDSRQATGLFWQ